MKLFLIADGHIGLEMLRWLLIKYSQAFASLFLNVSKEFDK